MSNSAETYNVNESFPILMATCVKYMRESLNARFLRAGFKVSNAQWNILAHLAQQDGISQQDLADRYDRSKVTAFNLLNKLEKRGLVIRHPDPNDGRGNLVYLTPEGRKLQRTLIPFAKANIARMSTDISKEELELLKSVVRKITGNIKV